MNETFTQEKREIEKKKKKTTSKITYKKHENLTVLFSM